MAGVTPIATPVNNVTHMTHVTHVTMDKTPVFIYDRITSSCELVFVPNHLLSRTHLRMDDRKNDGESVYIRIPAKLPNMPHYIITHFDGEDFDMFVADDSIFGHLKTLTFTREIIEKHLVDRDRDRNTPPRHMKPKRTIASRLRLSSS